MSDAGNAFAIGVLTIVSMLSWERYLPAALRSIPGALVGVVVGTLIAYSMQLPVARVAVPESIFAAIALPGAVDLARLLNPATVATAIAIAFIASAETLLSAAAVDRMHDGPRADYNKELRAQGIGNFLCGAAGALPMTGVIVRSSANVQAGALTRTSTILHGVWILCFVMALPWLLREIPMAALAGILVVTGWRLVSLQHARHLFHQYGVLPALIWAGTMIMVVVMDLLTGVLVGLALSLLELLPIVRKLKFHARHVESDGAELQLVGAATFVTLPKLTRVLDQVSGGSPLRLNISGLHYIDHTCAEVLIDWIERRRKAGTSFELIDVAQASRKTVLHRVAAAATA